MKNNGYILTSTESRKATRKALALYAAGITSAKQAVEYCNDNGIGQAEQSIIVAYISYRYAMDNTTTVTEYLKQYADFKLWACECLNDFGALNDLFECLIRIASKRNFNLVKLSDIRVKTASQTDITLNGVKYEIASNGKTWTQGTQTDYMSGNFVGVIYGVFEKQDMIYAIDCIKQGNVKTAVNYIASLACIWTEKHNFQYAMDSLTRGKGITYKPCLGRPQTVYNAGKYKAFVDAIGTIDFICYGNLYHI